MVQRSNSNDFLDLIQCIVVCGHVGIVNLVESNHHWVSSLRILHNTTQHTQIN